MAKPIEPTPQLDGEDAQQLADSLAEHASPEEMDRRRAAARHASLLAAEERGRVRGLREAAEYAESCAVNWDKNSESYDDGSAIHTDAAARSTMAAVIAQNLLDIAGGRWKWKEKK
jgi:hypothetical protein